MSAKYLGPVLSLDGEVTKNAQNLIFARNGAGKSFLSRAFRYLDSHCQGMDISDAARNLVSDESLDGTGTFSFSRGTQAMGTLQLGKTGDIVSAQVDDTIFHVFSEDFVQDELRQRLFVIDGEIENEISVDAENIKIKDAHEALEKAKKTEAEAFDKLSNDFDSAKISELADKAGINKQLREYKALDFPSLIEGVVEKPATPEPSFADILKDLDSLKSLPSEPAYPSQVTLGRTDEIDLATLNSSLARVTSPSSVSETIKRKIEAHHEFYATGVEIVEQEDRSTCPFCEQGIKGIDPKSVIDSYMAYFSDEEEKHRAELRVFFRALQSKEEDLDRNESDMARQKTRYDGLKRYVPSKKDTDLDDSEVAIQSAREAISSLKKVIEEKAQALSVVHSSAESGLIDRIAALNKIIEASNTKAQELANAVEKADEERKTLQRSACSVFGTEFVMSRWIEIEALKLLQGDTKVKAGELSTLEKSNPSTKARDRVAETFELLLREFFGQKYIFDKGTFTIKRGSHDMSLRGPHRILSDGEKTAIAFCYFIACIHRKVSANGDYQRLFLVFDDPVTSMSYDFVFAIAQTLKNLSISKQGQVSINPGLIDGNQHVRPELLILTHSSYFFNISLTNRVVADHAAFALHPENNVHKIARLDAYVAPFQQQLRDVYETANGRAPDYGTANAVRSVLEAVGRFCRPDKTKNLTDFISFLAGEEGMSLKSVLINSLSHGSYYDETPPPDDITLACKETIEVVEKYAVGQLEIIRGSNAT